MYRLIADTHCHTTASTHAFSTLLENARYAADIGLKVLAITDHGPKNADAPHPWYFNNLPRSVPRELCGITILRGVEADIMDFEGTLDLSRETLSKLDWVVVSYHHCNCPVGTAAQHTNAYLKVAQVPEVDVIGHSGSPDYVYDYDAGIKAFREYGKLVEINQNSFRVRKQNIKNCTEIARLCKKYRVPVVVNSDAHFCTQIGMVDDAMQMLEEIDFPKDLILNLDLDRFREYLLKKRDLRIP